MGGGLVLLCYCLLCLLWSSNMYQCESPLPSDKWPSDWLAPSRWRAPKGVTAQATGRRELHAARSTGSPVDAIGVGRLN